jgi:hypothetical protein
LHVEHGKVVYSQTQDVVMAHTEYSAARTEETSSRKISVTRLHNGDVEPRRGSLIGWESTCPRKGDPYLIYLHEGMLLKTSPVQEVNDNGDTLILKTVNSVYQVEYIQEGPGT